MPGQGPGSPGDAPASPAGAPASPGGGQASPDSGSTLSADARRAVLDRDVKDKTRELRATLESRGDFHAVLARGLPVNHNLHFAVLLATVALMSTVGRFFVPGVSPLLLAAVGAGGYGLFWLALGLTGGLERERIEVDERGALTSTLAGKPVETRDNVLKVAIPATVVVLGVYLAVALVHDIAVPPPPHCTQAWLSESDPCVKLPDFGNLAGGAAPTRAGSPAETHQPSYVSVSDTRLLERLIRVGQLVIVLVVTLVAVWFLRRMLNGKGVLWLEAVRGKKE